MTSHPTQADHLPGLDRNKNLPGLPQGGDQGSVAFRQPGYLPLELVTPRQTRLVGLPLKPTPSKEGYTPYPCRNYR